MNEDLNSIGILGLGSLSTTFYIQSLNDNFQAINGGFSTCPFLMLNANFDLINPFLPNNFGKLHPVLLDYLNALNALKVEKILLPNITIHEAIESMKWENYAKIIHPIDESIDFLQSKAINEVVLFGTIFTMNSTYFQNKFESKRIKIVKPSIADQEQIDQIRQHVYEQNVNESIISQYHQLIEKYSKKNVVLVACTELSMIPLVNASFKVVDMASIQIKKALFNA